MTAYEKWMEEKIIKETGYKTLSKESLKMYQLTQIRKTIDIAKRSKFYREVLKDISSDNIKDIKDFEKLPLTTSEDLVKYEKNLLCVSQEQVSRIVTINSSGTLGAPKRIYFTENDLKATSEFFAYGMLNLVTTGERVLILMSGNSPSSIAKLLKTGLLKAGCKGIIYGPVLDIWDTLETIKSENIGCIVGLPIQVYYLAKLKNTDDRYKNIKLNSILLSADYVPKSLKVVVGSAFNCPVFTHYGMTEMGYGGGVECSALNGYHMREADLYTEIIDPTSLQKVPEGTFGEVVFTTLQREGMPLLRYRTGDIARFLPKDCSCSNAFKRMDYVIGRLSECIELKDGRFLSIGMIDEIMFGIESVLDYKISISTEEKIVIKLSIKPVNQQAPINFSFIENCLRQDKCLGMLIENNNISMEFSDLADKVEVSNGMTKRKLFYKKKCARTS